MPFLLRATPRQDLADWSLRSEVNLTVTGHSRDTPDQTPDATEHRLVVASHPPSGHSAADPAPLRRQGRQADWLAVEGDAPAHQQELDASERLGDTGAEGPARLVVVADELAEVLPADELRRRWRTGPRPWSRSPTPGAPAAGIRTRVRTPASTTPCSGRTTTVAPRRPGRTSRLRVRCR